MADSVCSIVIPAHNEQAVIGGLLEALVDGPAGEFEILVVCNGCDDDTATVAQRFGQRVQVIEIAEPSKRLALERGNVEATRFPRLLVDADVGLSAASVRRLVDHLSAGRTLAAAPRREVPRAGVSPWVRWYYDVWERLPQVQDGLFGRGVIALSSDGYERLQSMPRLMGDDLVASEAFDPKERAVVENAVVVVWPPKSLGDLLRRRIRAVTGNAEADRAGVRGAAASTSIRTLVALARAHPRLVPRLPVFVAVGLVSRARARRAVRAGDTTTWLRDDSSRERVDPARPHPTDDT